MQTKALFRVKKTGLKTSFQDQGRHGYQDIGVPVSGAMDNDALQIGNLLVGNSLGTAGLEVALLGPVLEVLHDTIIAITGAHLSPHINGRPMKMWQAVPLREGDQLSFAEPVEGVYAYITVTGGFAVKDILGSQSTYDAVPLGELIAKGDVLQSYESGVSLHGWGLLSAYRPRYKQDVTVRIIRGAHEDHFTKTGVQVFYQQKHRITPQSNRVGYRLDAAAIHHKKNRKLLTSMAAPLGGIQVPADGGPIILMRDHQTTGGYPLIGTVIAADLFKIAQLSPGGRVRFIPVTIAEAESAYRQTLQFLRVLQYMLHSVYGRL